MADMRRRRRHRREGLEAEEEALRQLEKELPEISALEAQPEEAPPTETAVESEPTLSQAIASIKRPASSSSKRAWKKARQNGGLNASVALNEGVVSEDIHVGQAEDEIEQQALTPQEVDGKVEVAQVEVERPPVEPGAVPQLAQSPQYIKRHKLAKQSGVPGVCWNSSMWAWLVHWPKLDDKGNRTGKRKTHVFSISSFMKQGLTKDEAAAAALEAAKASRADLVRQGLVKEPKAKDPQFTSDVYGVTWCKAAKKWRVQISPKQTKGKEGPKQMIAGGYFAEKAAAEAKALELAEAHGLQRSVRPVGRFEELRVVQPKAPYTGVNWRIEEQQWHAQIIIRGAKRHFRVKPKDFSEAELERSFQEAVAWHKRQVKEKEKLRKGEDEIEQEELTPEEVEGKVKVAQVEVERPPSEPGAVWQQVRRDNLAKQSGVPGVIWASDIFAWQVKCPKLDATGKIIGKTGRVFSISSFMKQGLTEDEADTAALEAAKAFRADLVCQGLVKEPKAKDPQFTSDVYGVNWHKGSKKWRVLLHPKQTKGKEGAKKIYGIGIYGGYFKEKAAAEAKALELAEAHGLQRSVKPVGRFEDLRVVQPKVPYRGVTWDKMQQKWRAQIRLEGKSRSLYLKPKDFSEAELERSFQEAVAWKKKEEEKKKLRKAEDKGKVEEGGGGGEAEEGQGRDRAGGAHPRRGRGRRRRRKRKAKDFEIS